MEDDGLPTTSGEATPVLPSDTSNTSAEAVADVAAETAGIAATDASVALDASLTAEAIASDAEQIAALALEDSGENAEDLEELEESWRESTAQLQQSLVSQGTLLMTLGESVGTMSASLQAILETQRQQGELLTRLLSEPHQNSTQTEPPSGNADAQREAEIPASPPEAAKLEEKQEARRKRRIL